MRDAAGGVFGARVAFSSRVDGSMSFVVGDGDALRARTALAGGVGASLDDLVFMEQVHAADVAVVDRTHRGRGARTAADAIAGADALVAFEPGVALAVLVADCVPVLLVDPGRAVAAVHAGRRGVEAEIVRHTLEVLAPPAPERVFAFVGPAIGPCCYEVSAQLQRQVCATVPAAAATTRRGLPALDLPAAVGAALHQAGVRHVRRDGACTRCRADEWFSHRATQQARNEPGRQAGVVVRLPRSGPAASYTER